MNDNTQRDPRLFAIPDTHGHCKGEHKPYAEERPLPLTARMLFLWFYHACRRGYPRFLMVADHMNYLTFEDPAAVNLVRRALKLAQAGDLYGAAETASVDVSHAAVVGEGLRRGMHFSIGAEVDNDPRSRPDAQNIVDAMRPDAMIRSVHFVPITHPVHGENWPWPFDNPEFKEHLETVGAEQLWALYVTALLDAIERLPGHIVGHFYVPTVIGAWPDEAKLEEYEDRVLAAAADRGMAIEFNTRFLYRDHPEEEKRRYLDANRRFLRKAKERGVGIAIGSDAHSPKDQGAGFESVLAVLDELEINEIVFPIAGRLLRVALKVVREPEPEPVAAPPEPVKAEAPAAPAEAEAPKPVRKARPAAAPTRSRISSPERQPDRPHGPPTNEPSTPSASTPSASEAEEPAGQTGAASTAAPAPEAPEPEARAKETAASAKSRPEAKRAVAKPAAAKGTAPKAPAAKAPVAKAPAAKAPAKASAAKKAPAAKAKASAKKAKPAAKKAAPARTGAKKAAARPATAKKAAPARASTAKKAPAKKAAAAKKPTAKKMTANKTPARNATVRKAAAKKPVAKKSAKRR